MERILEYLRNPMLTGVYYSQFTLDISMLEGLFRYLIELAKEKRRRSKELIDAVNKIQEMEEEGWLEDVFIKHFEEAIRQLIRLNEIPTPPKKKKRPRSRT